MRHKQRLVIWGARGHAKVVHDAAVSSGAFQVIGFIDDVTPGGTRATLLGLPIFRELAAALPRRGARPAMVVAIGDNAARMRIAQRSRDAGLALATVVHASATLAPTARLGAGTVVLAGSIVNGDTRIGDNTILNTASSVDHDCVIGHGVHLCPGTCLGGHVTVGDGAWIGLGASVIDHLDIGARTVVGAGAVVTRSLPADCTAFGVPAQVRAVGANR